MPPDLGVASSELIVPRTRELRALCPGTSEGCSG